uniref:Uncharacterized protein n=1 Tax=Rhizophora mucronata TaxID=61149 RepID=A0A2P2QCH4_RHIMU
MVSLQFCNLEFCNCVGTGFLGNGSLGWRDEKCLLEIFFTLGF